MKTIVAFLVLISFLTVSPVFGSTSNSLTVNYLSDSTSYTPSEDLDFSAFNGVETLDVSQAELDAVSGEYYYLIYLAGPAIGFVARWAVSNTGIRAISSVFD
ncbi:MAG: hypothetical protein D3914_02560 [Candidatus Electrothrix sp. LOE2]|nr:hypothetical protein [Candidatus Electrothrix sp. LOE2]